MVVAYSKKCLTLTHQKQLLANVIKGEVRTFSLMKSEE